MPLPLQFTIIYLRPRRKASTTRATEQAGQNEKQQQLNGASCGGTALGCTPLDRWKRRGAAEAADVDFSPLANGMRKSVGGSVALVASHALQSDRQQQQQQQRAGDIEQQQQRGQSEDGSDVSPSVAAAGGGDGEKGDSDPGVWRRAVDGVKALWRRCWHSIRETSDFK